MLVEAELRSHRGACLARPHGVCGGSVWVLASLANCCVKLCTKSSLNLPPAELPLKMLTVKVGGSQTEAELIARVLRRAPRLTSLHLCGVRLAAGCSQAKLLGTVSGTVPPCCCT